VDVDELSAFFRKYWEPVQKLFGAIGTLTPELQVHTLMVCRARMDSHDSVQTALAAIAAKYEGGDHVLQFCTRFELKQVRLEAKVDGLVKVSDSAERRLARH
jgi:hypothetical protein